MTRVRMCSKHPGLIVRHHDFENFPTGTTPHTTVPLDYLILGLSTLLKPFRRTRSISLGRLFRRCSGCSEAGFSGDGRSE
jgi:hypothetical protein